MNKFFFNFNIKISNIINLKKNNQISRIYQLKDPNVIINK